MRENVEYIVYYHLARHEMDFTIIQKTTNVESYTSTNLSNISAVCLNLVERIDRFWLNSQFSQTNEIEYTNGDFTRSEAVLFLVQRILNATYDLIDEARFLNPNTKLNIQKKLDNLVIRVKGESSVFTTRDFDKWGFKWPLYPIPKNGTRSKATLYSGIYNFFQNSFQVNNIRLMASDYIQFRSELEFYFWEDIDVPYEIVNAWYDPLQNTITIPIGITLIPMFLNDDLRDMSLLGVIVPHEIGHSIENNGRLFDEVGNYVYNSTVDDEGDDGIWFVEDLLDLNISINCLAEDYGHPCDNENYGYHTMGEDIADQIGVRTAMRLFLDRVYTTFYNQYGKVADISKKTLLKDFFVKYAQLWCGRSSINNQCNQVKKDPHALAKHRVNKTLRQIREFIEAFQCRANSNMYKPTNETCLIYR